MLPNSGQVNCHDVSLWQLATTRHEYNRDDYYIDEQSGSNFLYSSNKDLPRRTLMGTVLGMLATTTQMVTESPLKLTTAQLFPMPRFPLPASNLMLTVRQHPLTPFRVQDRFNLRHIYLSDNSNTYPAQHISSPVKRLWKDGELCR